MADFRGEDMNGIICGAYDAKTKQYEALFPLSDIQTSDWVITVVAIVIMIVAVVMIKELSDD
jgi:hypothetical protein